MKYFKFFPVFLILLNSYLFAQTEVKYKVAITMDDLPIAGVKTYIQSDCEKMFGKLITEIKKQNTPIVGFVNEIKLNTDGKTDENKIKLLENWLDAGFDLGNHTYSHLSANKVPVSEYEEDIIKGEKIIKKLIAGKGKQIKYFRHPFLNTGLSLEVRDEIVKFLKNHGYSVAPVTLDNSEWIFAAAYETAYKKKDNEMMNRIGEEYVSYMKRKIEYYEGRSKELFGRNISHVLLVHANRLNSEYYGALCSMIRGLNYDIVPLDEVLKDEAYKSEDTFIGKGGISWMDRWAITRKVKKDFFAGEPACPGHIMKYAGIDSE